MPAGKRAINHLHRLEVLKKFQLFDSAENLLPESNDVWKQASKELALGVRNLYEYVKQERRSSVKKQLLEYFRCAAKVDGTGFDEKEQEHQVNAITPEKKTNAESLKQDTLKDHDNLQLSESDESSDNNDVDEIEEVCTMIEIQNLRKDIEFKRFIRFSMQVPFCLMYWSPEQIRFYQVLKKKLYNLELLVRRDIVQSVKNYGFKSGKISFYCVLGTLQLSDSSTHHSISQALLENDCKISLWLSSWLQSGASVPTQIKCPPDVKVISAVCDAFNASTYFAYLQNCFSVFHFHLAGLKANLPSIVYIDIAIFLLWIEDLPYLNNRKSAKTFYKKAFLYLSTITDAYQFLEELKKLFVLVKSGNTNEHCSRYRQHLLDKATQIPNPAALNVEIDSINLSKLIRLVSFSEEKIYFKGIVDQLSVYCNDDENDDSIPNGYCCQEFLEDLMLLCINMPLWSGIYINPLCCTEVTPADLYIPNDSINKEEVPHFFQKNIKKIEHEMAIARKILDQGNSKTRRNNSKKIDMKGPSDKLDSSYLHQYEDWMGLNERFDNFEDVGYPSAEEIGESSEMLFTNSKDFSEGEPSVGNFSESPTKFCNKELANSTISMMNDEQYDYSIDNLSNIRIESEKKLKIEINDSIKLDFDDVENSMAIQQKTDAEDLSNGHSKLLNTSDYHIFIDHSYSAISERSEQNENYSIKEVQEPEKTASESIQYSSIPMNSFDNHSLFRNSTWTSYNNKAQKVRVFSKWNCPIDSMTELFISSLKRNSLLRKMLQNTPKIDDNLNIFKIIADYAKNNFSLDYFYQLRIEVMMDLKEIDVQSILKKKEIEGTYSISQLFSRLLSANNDNYQLTYCFTCNKKTEEALNLVRPTWNELLINGISCLNEVLDTDLRMQRSIYCHRCDAATATLFREIKSMLIIDLEDLYRDSIRKGRKKMSTKLSEIPVKIRIKNNYYDLCGLIAFDDSMIPAHYFTYIRLAINTWEMRNDMYSSPELIKNEYSSTIKIAILMYTRFS